LFHPLSSIVLPFVGISHSLTVAHSQSPDLMTSYGEIPNCRGHPFFPGKTIVHKKRSRQKLATPTLQVHSSHFCEKNCCNVDFQNIDFQKLEFQNVDFQNVDFQNVDFQNVDFQNVDFQNVDFQNFDFQNVDFQNVDFQNFDFQNVDFQNVDFRNVNFQNIEKREFRLSLIPAFYIFNFLSNFNTQLLERERGAPKICSIFVISTNNRK
jgi:hypothetical protein